MLENDLREMFAWQASADQPPSLISFPVARRRAQIRRRWRRVSAIGAPIVAAAAAVAIALTAMLVSGANGTNPAPAAPAAPRAFNPLVPYAAATWYPFRPARVGSSGWRRALLLRATTPTDSTAVVLYAAGQCTLAAARLSCGAPTAGTTLELTVSGPAPYVQGQQAYWTRYIGGELRSFRPAARSGGIVAFQYARGGWAVAESTGTPADVLRLAASLRYGQIARVQFPFRLTGLPSTLSDPLYASIVRPGPGAQGPSAAELVVGSPADRPGTPLRNALIVSASTKTVPGPRCAVKSVVVNGHGSNGSKPASCPTTEIHGYRAYLNSPPSPGKQTLFVPDADGLYLSEQAIGPDAPLSPSAALADHLQLLGPNPADWTTSPIAP
jgi:hypothetical protein